MKSFWQDLRYGGRKLIQTPGFTVVALLTLTFGIGANTAIFSVINAVLFRPLPFEQPDRLVQLWENNLQEGEDRNEASPANFLDWRQQSQSFAEMSALVPRSFNLTDANNPERVQGQRVSANLFRLLGTRAALGRAFNPDEEKTGNDGVVVLSHGLWQRRFGSDSSMLDRMLTLNGRTYKVIGVMPSNIQFPPNTDLWVPLVFEPREAGSRERHFLYVTGRLKPGVSLEQAQSEMSTIARNLAQQYPESNTNRSVHVASLHEEIVGPLRPAMIVLLAAVGFVLLIACANVASLFLARAAARQREVAIRAALGASPLRLLRQMLTEGVLLSIIGGVFGLLLALVGVRALVAAIPGNLPIPNLDQVGIDLRVLGFTLLVSVLTGILVGLAPAFQIAKPNFNETLKEGGRGTTDGVQRNRLRKVLVVSEVVLAMVLLVGAGLMIKSLFGLLRADPGFNPNNVLTMQLMLAETQYPESSQQAAFYQQVLQRVGTLPGVETVGGISNLPLGGTGMTSGIVIEGRPAPPPGQELEASYRVVSPDYFKALGIDLINGRQLTESDNVRVAPVVVINEQLAQRYWPNENPIGKRMIVQRARMGDRTDVSREVVGVVRTYKHWGLDRRTQSEVYVPYLQTPFPTMTLVVRSARNVPPASLTASVRSQIHSVDKDLPVFNVKTMDQVVSESVVPQRLSTLLLGVFAILAMMLAGIGIYGILAYFVTNSSHNIGVRMALGASRGNILKLIVRQGMFLTLVGIGIGALAAVAVARLMKGLLVGVSTTDPLVFGGIALLLALVALMASFIPARRATKVDPLIVLRNE